MSAPQLAPFTAADYREMPDDSRRYQLVEGELQRFIFAESAAKPVALIDEPETFASPLFPDLTLATTEIFRR
jgi:hypothetical protein